MATTAEPIQVAPTPPDRRGRIRRWPRWRPALRRVHKWVSLLIGSLLLVVVVSGVAILQAPEIDQLTKPELYRATPTDRPVSFEAALSAVNREHPDFDATTVVRNRGIYDVYDKAFLRHAHVDPGTGEVLGTRAPRGGVLGFFQNLHMCLLSCEGYTAYVPVMAHSTHIPWGHDGEDLTVAGATTAVVGLALVLLCLSGLVLWWPGIRRFARGFALRRGQGRYKRDYDLHKVVGFAALPFLLMWAVTGTGFELRAVESAWYAVLPGSALAAAPTFASRPGERPDIGARNAERAALRAAPGGRVWSVTVPAAKDPKGYYDVWVQPRGLDPARASEWGGTIEVAVDRTNASRTAVIYGRPEDRDRLAERLWQDWNFPLHAGFPVGWLPRNVFVLMGLVPLLLALTGISMLLYKRGGRRARRAAPG